MPSKCRLFKNQDMTDANITWACGKPEPNPVPDGVGRSDRRDSRGQAVQRDGARHRGQPAGGAGPDGGAHGAGDHARRAAEARPRVRARRRQADDGFAVAAAGRRGRQVPGAAAGKSQWIENTKRDREFHHDEHDEHDDRDCGNVVVSFVSSWFNTRQEGSDVTQECCI